ncbi:hypothetical protein LBMAG38_12640 [Chloroflexota bacterium]|nr:hypothetical protein LBMAG38_12640 [Chloroflexota bacterium]
MTSYVSTPLAYNRSFLSASGEKVPIRKTGTFAWGSGRVSLLVRRRAIWIGVVILTSVLAPCHAPDAGLASATDTWQNVFVCPTWLLP